MAGKYTEISEQTRQNFIDAFWQLYEKKDINKIKVQEICDIAGYHRNTFYRYFTDVYDVLNQIEDRIIDELIENSDGQMYSREKTAEIFSKIYMKHKKYLCVLANEKYKSGFPEKMKKILRPFYDGIFRYSLDNKNDYILEYKLSGTIAAIMHYFKSNDDFPLEDLLNLIIELITSGNWPLKNR